MKLKNIYADVLIPGIGEWYKEQIKELIDPLMAKEFIEAGIAEEVKETKKIKKEEK